MRVARQAYAALLYVNNPASRESLRTFSFVSPHSLNGDFILSSPKALKPGRSLISSEAFVPSIIVV